MGDTRTVSALYPIYYLLSSALQGPGCKVFRAMRIKASRESRCRIENGIKTQHVKSPIIFWEVE